MKQGYILEYKDIPDGFTAAPVTLRHVLPEVEVNQRGIKPKSVCKFPVDEPQANPAQKK